jgi:tRNA threonylcarbamoyladenosine biosynthesis protein TsaE
MWEKVIPDEHAMLKLGAELAAACGQQANIFLVGQLGAGKTTFTRGFLRGLGFKGHVKSPTYTLVESYSLKTVIVHHFDFYRLRDAHELEFIGIQDYFLPGTICLIEWPEQGEGFVPQPDLLCAIEVMQGGREIKINAHSPLGEKILQQLSSQHD